MIQLAITTLAKFNEVISPVNEDISPVNKDISPVNKDVSPVNEDVSPVTVDVCESLKKQLVKWCVVAAEGLKAFSQGSLTKTAGECEPLGLSCRKLFFLELTRETHEHTWSFPQCTRESKACSSSPWPGKCEMRAAPCENLIAL